MAQPSAQDPLGIAPGPIDHLQIALRDMVSEEVRQILRGRTGHGFDGMADAQLAMELIARGWVCYKPHGELTKRELG